MPIVIGLDVHREQITYDALNSETAEVWRGRIRPATRAGLRRFCAQFAGQQLEVALEATTGWRFVVEELQAAGARVRLAEPADTRALRGPKRRAKTDRLDARHLRELCQQGRVPESWIPPAHIQDLRSRVRLRKALMDERVAWQQRIHAVLFHHGLPQERDLLRPERRQRLQELRLPPAARAYLDTALGVIDHLSAQVAPLDRELRAHARRQPGCRALMAHYGIGGLTSVVILAELGDPARFSSSRHAVRYAGLDITVFASDDKRAPGKLSRQGSPHLRWAAFEAAQLAARPASPDHRYYLTLKERLGANRAKLAIARKLVRRAHHTLRELGPEALAPAP